MTSNEPKKPAAAGDWLMPAAEAAARGLIAIRRCLQCGRNHYPPREICPFCLSDRLDWDVSEAAEGVLLAQTLLHHTNEENFRARIPLRVGLIQLQCGPTVVAFLADGFATGDRVTIGARLDERGRPVLAAISPSPSAGTNR
ncbi:MAG TPA: zinc ribbon domain-containing protein [Candidatus Binataceae bacterium]|nr:zinc ribbon domain-containing protein [Candidatus Binataceae bacterium]